MLILAGQSSSPLQLLFKFPNFLRNCPSAVNTWIRWLPPSVLSHATSQGLRNCPFSLPLPPKLLKNVRSGFRIWMRWLSMSDTYSIFIDRWQHQEGWKTPKVCYLLFPLHWWTFQLRWTSEFQKHWWEDRMLREEDWSQWEVWNQLSSHHPREAPATYQSGRWTHQRKSIPCHCEDSIPEAAIKTIRGHQLTDQSLNWCLQLINNVQDCSGSLTKLSYLQAFACGIGRHCW